MIFYIMSFIMFCIKCLWNFRMISITHIMCLSQISFGISLHVCHSGVFNMIIAFVNWCNCNYMGLNEYSFITCIIWNAQNQLKMYQEHIKFPGVVKMCQNTVIINWNILWYSIGSRAMFTCVFISMYILLHARYLTNIYQIDIELGGMICDMI